MKFSWVSVSLTAIFVASIFWSRSSPASEPEPMIELTSPNEEVEGYFGISVAGIPDVSGVGITAIAVGAWYEDAITTNSGRTYIFNGSDATVIHTLESPNSEFGGGFGVSVDGIPNTAQGGLSNVAVGAWLEDGGATDAGRAYIFDGTTGNRILTLESPNAEVGGGFGITVAGLPDLTGDGIGDIVIGAIFETVVGTPIAGRAYVFNASTGELLHTLESDQPTTGGLFGNSVAGVDDVNRDGIADIIVGAERENTSFHAAGRIYLFDGLTGARIRAYEPSLPQHDGEFGEAVAGLPDADGDGLGDIISGSEHEDAGATGSGRVYLFSGGSNELLHILESPTPGVDGFFGLIVAGLPDATANSFGEVIVGAPGEAQGHGRAHVYEGHTGKFLGSLQSPHPDSPGGFGESVKRVPDIDHDGIPEIVVGARYEHPGMSPLWSGRVYVFSGASVSKLANAVTQSHWRKYP